MIEGDGYSTSLILHGSPAGHPLRTDTHAIILVIGLKKTDYLPTFS
jgi:hypothetical protein